MTIRLLPNGLPTVSLRVFAIVLFTYGLSSIPAIAAEPIGRLFLTPQERHALDEMREHGTAASASDILAAAQPTHTATPRIIVNGIVERSDGKTTVWLNQLQQPENGRSQDIAVIPSIKHSSAVLIRLPSGKSIAMKAGQTFDTAQGIVREGYAGVAEALPQATQ